MSHGLRTYNTSGDVIIDETYQSYALAFVFSNTGAQYGAITARVQAPYGGVDTYFHARVWSKALTCSLPPGVPHIITSAPDSWWFAFQGEATLSQYPWAMTFYVPAFSSTSSTPVSPSVSYQSVIYGAWEGGMTMDADYDNQTPSFSVPFTMPNIQHQVFAPVEYCPPVTEQYGLQVFNAVGQETFDSRKRYIRLVDVVTVATNQVPNTFSHKPTLGRPYYRCKIRRMLTTSSNTIFPIACVLSDYTAGLPAFYSENGPSSSLTIKFMSLTNGRVDLPVYLWGNIYEFDIQVYEYA